MVQHSNHAHYCANRVVSYPVKGALSISVMEKTEFANKNTNQYENEILFSQEIAEEVLQRMSVAHEMCL